MSQTEKCLNCDGEGVVHTGVDEAPTTICPACDGDGVMDVFAAPAVANAAPKLPEPQSLIVDADIGHRAYSAEQVLAYGQACAISAQAPKAALTEFPEPFVTTLGSGNLYSEDQMHIAIEAAAAPNAALLEALRETLRQAEGWYDECRGGDASDFGWHKEAVAALAAVGVTP